MVPKKNQREGRIKGNDDCNTLQRIARHCNTLQHRVTVKGEKTVQRKAKGERRRGKEREVERKR